jgi:hypothetical protein
VPQGQQVVPILRYAAVQLKQLGCELRHVNLSDPVRTVGGLCRVPGLTVRH